MNNQLYDKIYENFVEEIDAIDNGIAVSDTPPRYIFVGVACVFIMGLGIDSNIMIRYTGLSLIRYRVTTHILDFRYRVTTHISILD